MRNRIEENVPAKDSAGKKAKDKAEFRKKVEANLRALRMRQAAFSRW